LRVSVLLLSLLALIVLAGTLHQAAHSVEDARARFYDSWIASIGSVPVPGGRSLFAALSLCSLASMALTPTLRKGGLLLIHLGLILLFAGVFQMSLFSRESFVALAEGEQTRLSVDPREYELVAGLPDSENAYGIPLKRLRPGSIVPIPEVGLAFHVERVYPHSRVVSPLEGRDGFTVEPESPPPRAEEARPGLVGTLEGAAGRLYLYGGATAPTPLETAGGTLHLTLRRIRHMLPFTVELVKFDRDLYPGGEIARGFSSVVAFRDERADRRVVVAMNRPARHRGYAFYQSSWGTDPDGREVSVLEVVRNPARSLPYLAFALTVSGMALHYAMRRTGAGRPERDRRDSA